MEPAARQAPERCQARVPATSTVQWGGQARQKTRHGLWTLTLPTQKQQLPLQPLPHRLFRMAPLRIHSHQVSFLSVSTS